MGLARERSQAPHGTGAHCAPARGKARSACTRTEGTGRRPVLWCTVHRRYRRCSGPAPSVIPQAITYKTPRTLVSYCNYEHVAYTSRVVFYRKVDSETAASLLAPGLSLLPAKAALLRHDMSPSWRQRIARRRSRQSSSIPAWSPSSAASRTSHSCRRRGSGWIIRTRRSSAQYATSSLPTTRPGSRGGDVILMSLPLNQI